MKNPSVTRSIALKMRLSFFTFLCATCIGLTDLEAQTTDLARIEFTYFPQSESDNSFRRFRSFINFPIPLWEDNYLVPGVEYRNINMKLRDDFPFLTGNKERFESYKVSLGYIGKLNNNWRYAGKLSISAASDFADGLINDDIIYGLDVFFIKDKTGDDAEGNPPSKPWRLIFGLSYDTTAGRPFPLPVFNYFRRFHPDWSYTVGVPKSNLKYYVNDKNIIQGFVTLDGFFANVQENFDVGNGDIAENISMTTLLSGVGYEYYLTDHLLLYLYAGYTIINDIRFRDGDQNDVVTLNDANSFYGRTGIKFKI